MIEAGPFVDLVPGSNINSEDPKLEALADNGGLNG